MPAKFTSSSLNFLFLIGGVIFQLIPAILNFVLKEARFIWNEKVETLDIVDLFKNHIAERKILFDEETSIIYNPSDFREGALITSGRYEMVRLEGTATADRKERLYYDAFLIREIKSGFYLYAESKSSVLNGLVEGPYFEAVMTRMELLEN